MVVALLLEREGLGPPLPDDELAEARRAHGDALARAVERDGVDLAARDAEPVHARAPAVARRLVDREDAAGEGGDEQLARGVLVHGDEGAVRDPELAVVRVGPEEVLRAEFGGLVPGLVGRLEIPEDDDAVARAGHQGRRGAGARRAPEGADDGVAVRREHVGRHSDRRRVVVGRRRVAAVVAVEGHEVDAHGRVVGAAGEHGRVPGPAQARRVARRAAERLQLRERRELPPAPRGREPELHEALVRDGQDAVVVAEGHGAAPRLEVEPVEHAPPRHVRRRQAALDVRGDEEHAVAAQREAVHVHARLEVAHGVRRVALQVHVGDAVADGAEEPVVGGAEEDVARRVHRAGDARHAEVHGVCVCVLRRCYGA